jgi:hypothetical protein
MRIGVLGIGMGLGVGAACSFPGGGVAQDAAGLVDGAIRIDGSGTIDAPAPPDATPPDASPPDARVCAPAAAGCVAFTCAATTSCYYVCSPRSWTSARAYCGTGGMGCIATIDDQPENDCLAAATNPMYPDLVFFGWRQAPGSSEPAGGWGWECPATGSYVAPNWGDFEPNEDGNEDCGVMGTGGAWIDGDCGGSLRFVCES